MTLVAAFHGTVAGLVICALLFAEETGVPLPLAPGELLLVAAGLLIATGELSPWEFIPMAILATTAGALTGYSWARVLGSAGLRAIAERLHAGRHLDRVSSRLQAAGPGGIAACRILPGMRINTTLVAGAARVPRRTFLTGAVPVIVIWVAVFTALGALVGVPIEHLIGRIDKLALRGAILLAVGLGGYLAARHVPAIGGHDTWLIETPGWWRLTLAAVTDLATVVTVVAGLDVLAHAVLAIERIDDWVDALSTGAVAMLLYLVLTRGWAGVTAGEALFRVTYRSRRRGRSPDSRSGTASDADAASHAPS